jgi:short-subunit dehydrogenase
MAVRTDRPIAPSNVTYHKCDITSTKDIAAAAQEIRDSHGAPTILVNNAGVARGKTILDGTEAEVRLTFDVNSIAHYSLAREFLPAMVKANHGIVVTVASLAAYVCAPNMVDYASSKSAALAFHEGLAAELKTRYNAPKVRTIVITQGFTRTPLFQGFDNNDSFMSPTLHPQTVAEGIVKKILSGESGHVILPSSSSIIITSLRSFPYWFQVGLRNKCQKLMKGWEGRQVIDPEERYATKE